jgi:hypothetical protein
MENIDNIIKKARIKIGEPENNNNISYDINKINKKYIDNQEYNKTNVFKNIFSKKFIYYLLFILIILIVFYIYKPVFLRTEGNIDIKKIFLFILLIHCIILLIFIYFYK